MAVNFTSVPNLTVGNNLTVSISGHTIGNRLSYVLKVGGTTISSLSPIVINSTTHTHTFNISSLITTIYDANSGKSLTNAVEVNVFETTTGGTPVSNDTDYSNLVMNSNHRSTVSSWTSTYTIGNTITVNISKTYSSFRSAVAYYINGTLIKRVQGITGTSTSFTPNEDETQLMKDAMGGLATGTVSINLETGYVINTGTWYWGYRSYSGTASQTLTSVLTNGLQNFTVGSSGVTYNITRYNSSYVHTVNMYYWNGSTGTLIKSKTGQTTSAAFSLVDMTSGASTNIYTLNTTGNTVRIRMEIITYESNGITQVGTAQYYTGDGTTTGVATFDTSLIRPTFTSYGVTNTLNGITGNQLHWVQNKSTGTVTVSGAAGVSNSSITSYTAVIGGVSISGAGNVISIPALNLTGSQAISVYITDSRGNQSLTQTTPGPLTFYAYSAPSVTSILAYREAYNDDTPLLNLTYQISVVGGNVPTIQWRSTQSGGAPTGWTTITNPGGSGGVYTLTGSTILGTISSSFAYTIEFQIKDLITTSYSAPFGSLLPEGRPILHMEQGKVGINNATPTEALDVYGNIKASGIVYGGYGTGSIAVGSQGTPSFEAIADSSNAAYMNFHRVNSYAVRFGLDTDNQLKVGGWSMGNNAYKIFHEGNSSQPYNRYPLPYGNWLGGGNLLVQTPLYSAPQLYWVFNYNIRANPNTSGATQYRSFVSGKLFITYDWNGSYLVYRVRISVETQFSSGGELNITPIAFWNSTGTQDTGIDNDLLYIQVGGFISDPSTTFSGELIHIL